MHFKTRAFEGTGLVLTLGNLANLLLAPTVSHKEGKSRFRPALTRDLKNLIAQPGLLPCMGAEDRVANSALCLFGEEPPNYPGYCSRAISFILSRSNSSLGTTSCRFDMDALDTPKETALLLSPRIKRYVRTRLNPRPATRPIHAVLNSWGSPFIVMIRSRLSAFPVKTISFAEVRQ